MALQAFDLGHDLHVGRPEILLATGRLEAVVAMQYVVEDGQEFHYLWDGPDARLLRLDMAFGELGTIVDATTVPAVAGKKSFGVSRYATERDLTYSFSLTGPDGDDSLDWDETVTLTDLGADGTMDRIEIQPPAGGKGRQEQAIPVSFPGRPAGKKKKLDSRRVPVLALRLALPGLLSIPSAVPAATPMKHFSVLLFLLLAPPPP